MERQRDPNPPIPYVAGALGGGMGGAQNAQCTTLYVHNLCIPGAIATLWWACRNETPAVLFSQKPELKRRPGRMRSAHACTIPKKSGRRICRPEDPST